MDLLRELWAYLKLVWSAYRHFPLGVSVLAGVLAFYNAQYRKPSDPLLFSTWLWAAIAGASVLIATFTVWRDTQTAQQTALPAWRRYELLAKRLRNAPFQTKALHKDVRPQDEAMMQVDYYLTHGLWSTAQEYIEEAIENEWAQEVDREAVDLPATVGDVEALFWKISRQAKAAE